jgi:hypothetical protein
MYEVARRTKITFGDNHGVISDSEEFDFDMDDIARIREEMKTLIQNLSRLYTPWKAEEVRKEKEEKAARKAAKMAAASRKTSGGVTETSASGSVIDGPAGSVSQINETSNEEPPVASGQPDVSTTEEAGTNPGAGSIASMGTENDSKPDSDRRMSESAEKSQNPLSSATESSGLVATENSLSEIANCADALLAPSIDETKGSPSLAGTVKSIDIGRPGRNLGRIDEDRPNDGVTLPALDSPGSMRAANLSVSAEPEKGCAAEFRVADEAGPRSCRADESPSDPEREQQDTPDQVDDDGVHGADDAKPRSRCVRNNDDGGEDGERDVRGDNAAKLTISREESNVEGVEQCGTSVTTEDARDDLYPTDATPLYSKSDDLVDAKV